jgi:hypothetical protein
LRGVEDPDSEKIATGMDPDLFRLRIWILPFSHKGVERTERLLAK